MNILEYMRRSESDGGRMGMTYESVGPVEHLNDGGAVGRKGWRASESE